MSKEFDENLKRSFIDWVYNSDQSISFDIHAQDPNDWGWLQQLVPGTIVKSAGGICPFQVEGIIQDYPFYYFERGGTAILRVSGQDDVHAGLFNSLYIAHEDVEEFRRGPAWIPTFLRLVENLERAPFFYDFPGKRVNFSNGLENAFTEEAEEHYGAWGHTPEEEYRSCTTDYFSPYLEEHGWTREIQRKIIALQEVSPTPLNKDDREFPNPEPVFEVKVPELWRNEENSMLFY